MTLGQFAALTGLSQVTVRKYLTEGRLEGVQVGMRWVISEEEYQRYLSEGLRPKEQ